MHSVLCPGAQNSITLWLLHVSCLHVSYPKYCVRSFSLQVKENGSQTGFNSRRDLLAYITKSLEVRQLSDMVASFVILYTLIS